MAEKELSHIYELFLKRSPFDSKLHRRSLVCGAGLGGEASDVRSAEAETHADPGQLGHDPRNHPASQGERPGRSGGLLGAGLSLLGAGLSLLGAGLRGGLRLDYGHQFVSSVLQTGSVRQVNQRTGGETVATPPGTPGDTTQHYYHGLAMPPGTPGLTQHYYHGLATPPGRPGPRPPGDLGHAPRETWATPRGRPGLTQHNTNTMEMERDRQRHRDRQRYTERGLLGAGLSLLGAGLSLLGAGLRGGLRLDYGHQFVSSVLQTGSVRQVNQRTGGETVATPPGTPGDTTQHYYHGLAMPPGTPGLTQHYYHGLATPPGRPGPRPPGDLGHAPRETWATPRGRPGLTQHNTNTMELTGCSLNQEVISDTFCALGAEPQGHPGTSSFFLVNFRFKPTLAFCSPHGLTDRTTDPSPRGTYFLPVSCWINTSTGVSFTTTPFLFRKLERETQFTMSQNRPGTSSFFLVNFRFKPTLAFCSPHGLTDRSVLKSRG
ncbi:hypothetical protein CRUP_015992 [Coryphaenoides rupestris]|nr:hypothetical protein CRUP_015992 [Coryphaenoides rupestris]